LAASSARQNPAAFSPASCMSFNCSGCDGALPQAMMGNVRAGTRSGL
jgi:hypothetical protein